ncbi:MAG: glycosyltransferase family 4 protein [Acetobacteraceae bacterium]|nr:glycosyltransferase family 4 protein [Acetobacteraceae bacterium]
MLTLSRVPHLGGVERVVLSAAEAARTHGLRPVLACPVPGRLAEEMARHNLPVRAARIERGRATISPWGLARTLSGFRRGASDVLHLALQERAGLLHVHHPVTAAQARMATETLGVPLLIHVHETLPMPPLYALLARLIRASCTLWLCVSEASRQMVRALGVADERVKLLYNAVEARFLDAPGPAAELAGPGPHLGLFGVLEPRKGHAIFLRALSMLNKFPTAQAWIVGAVSFADYRSYLDKLYGLARELGVGERVHFLGHRNDIPELMTAMDVVALASTGFESLPTVLIEACALGRPVVASDVGGVREIITHGKTGLIVPPGDARALAQALATILSSAGAQLGSQARADAQRRFTPERFGNELAECYRRLLREAEPTARSEPRAVSSRAR